MAFAIPPNAVSYWDKWKKNAPIVLGTLMTEIGAGYSRMLTWPYIGRYFLFGTPLASPILLLNW